MQVYPGQRVLLTGTHPVEGKVESTYQSPLGYLAVRIRMDNGHLEVWPSYYVERAPIEPNAQKALHH